MRRRKFISAALTGSAGLAVGAGGLLMSSCKGANDRVVLALIGAGGRGLSTISACCRENDGVEIKTICDVNDLNSARAAAEIEKQFGYRPQTVRYMNEIFADRDIDAVYISTPDHWHALATIRACQAGKDVYVEKSPSHSIREGRKMAEAAAKYRRIVQVGFQNRSAGYNHEAREYISSGRLGQVVHIRIYNLLPAGRWIPIPEEAVPPTLDWNEWIGPAPFRPYSPALLKGWVYFYDYCPGFLDDAVHQFDLSRMVMGDPGHPQSVYGWGGKHVWNSEQQAPEVQSVTFDYDKYTLTCESGNVTAYMSKTPDDIRMDPSRFPEWRTNADRIEIYGTSGVMFLGRQGGGWQVYGPKEEIVAQSGGIHSDREHQINFIECVRKRKQPNSTVVQGHMSATLAHMANIAYRCGNRQLLFDAGNERFIDNEEANRLLKGSYRENYIVPEKV
ncbi:MAG TPA: Gfo/Idh/MocA family oxidoreductase [Bacteroidales bacterium]|jgi:predicted dehydrogenase|nr:Gfo/Idh/MocA family oxidoreductase [Bacteroidales bacterium]HQH23508.1 Gfo/Idh/MocA family oxidoreductase [Bacteroidales bacterium]HQJ83258.1 Gfo/Idh/MocA family oxidoreductase [Bacteroidales bacterium]